MERILYENVDGTINILTPNDYFLYVFGIDAIAKKDIPNGLPYWVVPTSSIPTDTTYRAAWVADRTILGDPHGYGSLSNEFEVL